MTSKEYAAARREHAVLLRNKGMTLRAIGLRLGVSHERVRQMIKKFERLKWRAT
jgi:DNA-directed RNA polymerase sigma subunit (sigma70/sigma32)